MSRRWLPVLHAAALLFGGLLAACQQQPPPSPDLNGDGRVNVLDVSLVSSCQGIAPTVDPRCAPADTNHDGDVDQADFDFVVAHFNECVAGGACATGSPGVCSSGAFTCPGGLASAPVCTPRASPTSETCDSLDNDCNGIVDNDAGVVGPGSDVGECQPQIQSCTNGQLVVTQEEQGPVPELCRDDLDQDCDGQDCVRLDLVILSPTTGATTRLFSIDVSGTVNPLVASVEVNGIAATVAGGEFQAQGIELQEGFNTLTATALDAEGNAATSSVSIVVDNKAPTVSVDSHEADFVTHELTIDVAGLVNDIVVGTVNPGQASVTVNGVVADVLNRSYLARGVALTSDVGGNVQITAVGTDAVGNVSDPVVVAGRFEVAPPGEPRIAVVSGSGQSGAIGSVLPAPLLARLTDAEGNPAAGQTVIFRVTENNGQLSDGTRTADAVAVATDADGRAQSQWTLGTRAGAGNQVVEASSVGITAPAVFTALASAGSADRIVVDSGNQQTGPVGKPLARPLVAVVVDSGSNRLGGVPVTFSVQQGGGRLEGSANGGSSAEVATDSDGRALAVLTLGPDAGIDNNVVTASYAVSAGFPASFSASAKVPGDAAATSISGVVLDNTNQPIEGVHIEILDSNVEVDTDAQGQFRLQPAPVGTVFVDVDGRTANRSGTWPTLEYEVVTVPGVDNPIPHPIYLLKIAEENRVHVSEMEGGVLTIPELPGFSLTIAKGSVNFPNGGKTGDVSVTVVHADKIPMPPGFGQQPRLIVTIQPPGAEFNPPAPLRLPNVDGLAPGEATEFYSFDHDLGQFVAIGTGTVSKDGTVIASDPGVGIIEGGWHCGGNPTRGACLHQCPLCTGCDPECTKCIDNPNDPRLPACSSCVAGKPQPSTQSCCAEPAIVSEWNTPRRDGSLPTGLPICCGGRVEVCVSPNNPFGYNNETIRRLRECHEVHEEAHKPQVSCSSGCATQQASTSMNQGDSECPAYRASVVCLIAKRREADCVSNGNDPNDQCSNPSCCGNSDSCWCVIHKTIEGDKTYANSLKPGCFQ